MPGGIAQDLVQLGPLPLAAHRNDVLLDVAARPAHDPHNQEYEVLQHVKVL